MTTTTIDALIALTALALIVVPMLLIAVQDFCRFNPFKSRRRKLPRPGGKLVKRVVHWSEW